MNIRLLIHMVCVAVLAIGLYMVKYSVQDVQRNVASLKTELAREKESLHLLNAEWAYLNRPTVCASWPTGTLIWCRLIAARLKK